MDRRSFLKGVLAGGALAVVVPKIFQVPLGAPVGFARNHPDNSVEHWWKSRTQEEIDLLGFDWTRRGMPPWERTQEEIDCLDAYLKRVRDEASEPFVPSYEHMMTREKIDRLAEATREWESAAYPSIGPSDGEFIRATLDGLPSLRRVGKFWVSDDITRQVDEQLLDMDIRELARLAFRNGSEIDIQIRPLSDNHQDVMELADGLKMSPKFQEGLRATLVGTEERWRALGLDAGDGDQEKETTTL